MRASRCPLLACLTSRRLADGAMIEEAQRAALGQDAQSDLLGFAGFERQRALGIFDGVKRRDVADADAQVLCCGFRD